MRQLIVSLFKRDSEPEHRFLKENKIDKKLWNDMLKDIKK